MAEYLAHDMSHESVSLGTENYMKEWGVDMSYSKGGALAESTTPCLSKRSISLNDPRKHGKNLGRPQDGFTGQV